MILGLDSNKKENIIKTYKILEFLGDWSGFKDFLEIRFSSIGFYFSGQFFKQDMVTSILKKKDTPKSECQDI